MTTLRRSNEVNPILARDAQQNLAKAGLDGRVRVCTISARELLSEGMAQTDGARKQSKRIVGGREVEVRYAGQGAGATWAARLRWASVAPIGSPAPCRGVKTGAVLLAKDRTAY